MRDSSQPMSAEFLPRRSEEGEHFAALAESLVSKRDRRGCAVPFFLFDGANVAVVVRMSRGDGDGCYHDHGFCFSILRLRFSDSCVSVSTHLTAETLRIISSVV